MDYRIPYSYILFFSVERNYVSMTTVDKTYNLKSSLKKIAASLPKCFVQTSRASLVNLTNVSAISRTVATFGKYGKKAKITEQYLDDVQTAFIVQKVLQYGRSSGMMKVNYTYDRTLREYEMECQQTNPWRKWSEYYICVYQHQKVHWFRSFHKCV